MNATIKLNFQAATVKRIEGILAADPKSVFTAPIRKYDCGLSINVYAFLSKDKVVYCLQLMEGNKSVVKRVIKFGQNNILRHFASKSVINVFASLPDAKTVCPKYVISIDDKTKRFVVYDTDNKKVVKTYKTKLGATNYVKRLGAA